MNTITNSQAIEYRREDHVGKNDRSHKLKWELVWRAALRSRVQRAVDLGCGTGRFFSAVEDAPRNGILELIGVDASPEMLAQAQAAEGFSGHAYLVCADITTWNPVGTFDLVSCMGVVGVVLPLDVMRPTSTSRKHNCAVAYARLAFRLKS